MTHIVTSRATDYGLADVSCLLGNVDLATKDSSDAFMGPVTLHSLTALFTGNPGVGSNFACYLKVYDSLNPSPVLGVWPDPLWILQCWSGHTFTMNFPEGYAFTYGVSLRASRGGGTYTPGELAPDGTTRVTLLGRKP